MFIALWAVTLISFFIINLPEGDYVTAYIAQLQATGSMVDAEEADNLRAVSYTHLTLPTIYSV